MAKWILERGGVWVYDSLGFIAQDGDVLEADYAPDAYWSSADPDANETVTRIRGAFPVPPYAETLDRTPLVYSISHNRFIPDPDGPLGSGGGGGGTDGRGIVSIARTNGDGSPGSLDTYTITYSDATTSTFQVRNGANGSAGTDGTDGTNGTDGSDGTDGRGVVSIVRTAGDGSAGTTDTYTITYTDTTTVNFQIYNGKDGTDGTDGGDGADGRGIVSVVRTTGDGSAGTTDTYTITYSDSTTSTFTVHNGSDGTGSSNATDPNLDVTIDDPTNQDWRQVTIVDDGSATSGWPNRFEWLFGPTGGPFRRTFYFNEYGEARAQSAKTNTVALRVLVKEYATDTDHSTTVPVMDMLDNRDDRNVLFSIMSDGTVNAPNIGVPIAGVLDEGDSPPGGTPSGTIYLIRPA